MQIAPWLGPRAAAIFQAIRLSHQAVGDTLPNVATIVTHDLGDPLNPPPYSSMHPRNKTVVGNRLAAAALALGLVGESANAASWGGPAFASITRTSPISFTVQLTRASGLHMTGSDMCHFAAEADSGKTRSDDKRCCAAPDTFQLWPSAAASEAKAMAGEEDIACAVAADGASLHCVAAKPIAAGAVWTFAWQNYPPCILMNDALLPASTMRAPVPAV